MTITDHPSPLLVVLICLVPDYSWLSRIVFHNNSRTWSEGFQIFFLVQDFLLGHSLVVTNSANTIPTIAVAIVITVPECSPLEDEEVPLLQPHVPILWHHQPPLLAKHLLYHAVWGPQAL